MQYVRKPAVAGMFYEGDSTGLMKRLDVLFSGVKQPRQGFRMVVSPHAGYMYSGKTAAHAIASLKPAGSFIILGPNHTGMGQPLSIMSRGVWKTPLGECRIDSEVAEKLKACRLLKEDTSAHLMEHSIEVQLPLLQHRFREFSFVPVSMMNLGYSDDFLGMCEELGKAVAGVAKSGNVGVVASSDFSHYMSQKAADEKDAAAVKQILALSTKKFFATLDAKGASVCGFGPIAVAMSAAKLLGLKAKLISKSSSGDVTRDYGSVVTYYAIGFG
jgi:hypothetical protein